jgi:Na+/H+ antiporter NhaD/arsenite permease-like protein
MAIWFGALLCWLGGAGLLLGAEGEHALYEVPYWSAIPFVILLLGIALLPLTFSHWWHSNLNRSLFSFSLAGIVILFLVSMNARSEGASLGDLFHKLEEYVAFIILSGSLYVISGNIVLSGDIQGKPITNTGFLLLGAILGNFVGTTGASMLLIRPLLRINSERQRRSHIPIFFIFVVSNTGGVLTPLGDPPLFLGFLQGVDFFWTFGLWKQWFLVNGIVLSIFYIWDRLAYQKETEVALRRDRTEIEPLRLEGAILNGILLLGVIVVVLLHSKSVADNLGISRLVFPLGEILILILTGLAWFLSPKRLRLKNEFEWGPILEVAILFVGIFVTMVPALALLQNHGKELSLTQPGQYFWFTGMLSSFLDNAPTYLTFGTLAAEGNPIGWLTTNKPELLAAISCGAVFMGANTYIGNGPNFMVKAIAEKSGYPMPSFLGYLLYSCTILVPVFVLVSLLFF